MEEREHRPLTDFEREVADEAIKRMLDLQNRPTDEVWAEVPGAVVFGIVQGDRTVEWSHAIDKDNGV